MSNILGVKNGFRHILLGPLCILYFYLYNNYLRMSRPEDYARGWAPTSAVGLLLGPIIWLAMCLNNLFELINADAQYFPSIGGAIWLTTLIILMFCGSSFLRRNHINILKIMNGVIVPKLSILLFVVIAFSVPQMIIVVAFGKYHFWNASVTIVIYYLTFYVLYFRDKLKMVSGTGSG